MAGEEDDDLYDEEFDFVDDDDDDSELDDESPLDDRSPLDDEAQSDDGERDDLDHSDDGREDRVVRDTRGSRDDRGVRDERVSRDDRGARDERVSRDDRGSRDRQDDRDDDRVAPGDAGGALDDEPVDEYGRPEPAANYVVHVYEHQKFKRTIDRPFTPEEAETFATEFNRTGKSYGRFAVSGKNDAKPKKALD